MIARDPKIAYVLLRNAHFGPRLASSVELCVRDLVLSSRYARSTLVACPPVDEPFEGVEIATIPEVSLGGNLAKALGVARLMRRRGIDVAVVENHLPAAALIGATSGARAGLAFVSEDALVRFRANFPFASAPMRAIPNGLDMQAWSAAEPKDRSILSVGRALADKGHIEAIGAIARALKTRPGWSARFILSATEREPETVRALRNAADASGDRIRIDLNLPHAEVKAAWEKAAIGLALTKTPEPFGRTALEALASGAALIASGRGGLAGGWGPCAVTVDPNDAGGLAGGPGARVDAPDRRADLARAGRKRVEALFDIRAVARRMDDFIDACVGEGRAGS